MLGLRLAAETAFVSGGLVPILAVLEPRDLEGLGPVALATVVTISSLGVVVFLVSSLVPAIRNLVVEVAKNNILQANQIALLVARPCLIDGNVESAKREALAVVDEAKRVALNVVDDARKHALEVVSEAKKP